MQAETQDLDQRPVAEQSSAIEQVPIIDVGYLFQDFASSAAREAIDQIAEACRTWGFFQVINLGISSARTEQVWQQTHALFALPSVMGDESPALYDPIEWGMFRGKRSDGDYADYGSEVQIYQYRK